MRLARWRLRAVMIVVASLGVLCAGAVKWRRYALLRDRIALYSEQERRLLDEYEWLSRLSWRPGCGNPRRDAEVCREIATERRRQIEACERELTRIW
jgi:hypothetical protein